VSVGVAWGPEAILLPDLHAQLPRVGAMLSAAMPCCAEKTFVSGAVEMCVRCEGRRGTHGSSHASSLSYVRRLDGWFESLFGLISSRKTPCAWDGAFECRDPNVDAPADFLARLRRLPRGVDCGAALRAATVTVSRVTPRACTMSCARCWATVYCTEQLACGHVFCVVCCRELLLLGAGADEITCVVCGGAPSKWFAPAAIPHGSYWIALFHAHDAADAHSKFFDGCIWRAVRRREQLSEPVCVAFLRDLGDITVFPDCGHHRRIVIARKHAVLFAAECGKLLWPNEVGRGMCPGDYGQTGPTLH
jgi:hypothetical protein